ncbi:MAG: HEAT repeat domain-containing protein [Deltaproteobacteria bacterium]|nr:HEAT repeat domain-containing protein [Myxococcales bacterium]MDP3218842.1 HEAT repeat domain-containing protein [Deltaproteobacteria bacterium]
MRPSRTALLLGAALAGATGSASAQPRRPVATTVAMVHPTAEAPPGWDLSRADDVLARIGRAATGDPRRGALDISSALLAGVEPHVAAAGLDTLGVLARPESADTILRYLDHRRVSLRRRALIAAARLHTPAMLRAIDARLGDSDPEVRAEAARTLADVADPTSVRALWAAFEHEAGSGLGSEGTALLQESARALGARGSDQDVDRLLTYLRRAPFGALARAFEASLRRPELPNPVKLRVVQAIAGIATPQARELLTRLVDEHRGRPTPAIDAARSAVSRIQ